MPEDPSHGTKSVNVIIHPKPVVRALLAMIAFLVAAYWITYLIVQVGGRTELLWLSSRFDLDLENNIPTWFSSCLLLLSALLLFIIGAHEKAVGNPYSRQWRFLAFVFVGLSMDEVATIHETLIMPLRRLFGASGVLYYPWVVAGIALIIVVALYCFRWFWQLPKRTRVLAAIAAACYVAGAVGMEMVGGYVQSNKLRGYTAHITIEETLEMLGAALWVYALLEYAQSRFTLNVSFGRSPEFSRPAELSAIEPASGGLFAVASSFLGKSLDS